jgi:hypothetical protein
VQGTAVRYKESPTTEPNTLACKSHYKNTVGFSSLPLHTATRGDNTMRETTAWKSIFGGSTLWRRTHDEPFAEGRGCYLVVDLNAPRLRVLFEEIRPDSFDFQPSLPRPSVAFVSSSTSGRQK